MTAEWDGPDPDCEDGEPAEVPPEVGADPDDAVPCPDMDDGDGEAPPPPAKASPLVVDNPKRRGWFDKPHAYDLVSAPKRRLTSADRLVLVALLRHVRVKPGDPAMPAGECNPAVRTIAACGSLKRTAVHEALKRLRGTWIDVIEQYHPGTNYRAPSRYRLTFDRGVMTEANTRDGPPGG